MVELDEDAVICDFAEYYNIYDYKALPLSKAGIYAWGLPPDSRIKRLLANEPTTTDIVLLAAIADRLSFIAWSKTKDAEKGKNKPTSILSAIYGEKDKALNEKPTSYSTITDFEKARQELVNKIRDTDNG